MWIEGVTEMSTQTILGQRLNTLEHHVRDVRLCDELVCRVFSHVFLIIIIYFHCFGPCIARGIVKVQPRKFKYL